ncbi:MAG: sigma-70 family RNA polymerase sigma factor [Candidatus Krumholzibacteria bacterium]|nr:sigma-70 family RNA polymerase sigma factor [Candidatus Krumholzibacteria bacterium]
MTRNQNHSPTSRNPADSDDVRALLARDMEWAEKAATGDRCAFEQIYRNYQNRVYGLSLRLTCDVVEAEQLTQDTFVKAWFAIAGYTGRGQLGGWLGRVATNLWRDRYRSRARREQLVTDAATEKGIEAGVEPTATLSGAACSRPDSVIPLLTGMDLERCIARLPQGGRTVYVLHEIEGYTHREIAELLTVAVGTVKAQLHRARRLLRGMLTEENRNPDLPTKDEEATRGR